MTKIKICGITCKEEIDYINILKPDYIGLVFFKGSKRFVNLDQAKSLVSNLDRGIKKVGVFVNEDLGKVEKIRKDCDLDILQFHGDETEEYLVNFKGEIWKAVRVREREDLDKLNSKGDYKYLLDSFKPGQLGGTGESFNWDLVDKNYGKNIILAGGLTPSNVSKAIKKLRPYGVDVSSGVEKNEKKDFKLLKDFIENARRE